MPSTIRSDLAGKPEEKRVPLFETHAGVILFCIMFTAMIVTLCAYLSTGKENAELKVMLAEEKKALKTGEAVYYNGLPVGVYTVHTVLEDMHEGKPLCILKDENGYPYSVFWTLKIPVPTGQFHWDPVDITIQEKQLQQEEGEKE